MNGYDNWNIVEEDDIIKRKSLGEPSLTQMMIILVITTSITIITCHLTM